MGRFVCVCFSLQLTLGGGDAARRVFDLGGVASHSFLRSWSSSSSLRFSAKVSRKREVQVRFLETRFSKARLRSLFFPLLKL